MTVYNRNTFQELIFSNDPEKIDEGMELLKSIQPRTITDVFAEIDWAVIDNNSLDERMSEHTYLTLYLLGVMREFAVDWVIELEELEVNLEGLTQIPDTFMNLTTLSYLDLSGNQLTQLPKSIGNFRNLTNLNLSGNPFEHFPNNLVSLTTDNEQWEIFQTEICNMTTLKTLILYDEHTLTTLPDSFENLINLTSLLFIETKMGTIPDSVTTLTNLTELAFDSCQLTSLSDSIGHLTNLKDLILGYNRLTSLPESIKNLRNLTNLILSDNPISESEQARIQTLLPNCEIEF